MEVIKKDGTVEKFDISKISRAVKKSAERTTKGITQAQLDSLAAAAKMKAEELVESPISVASMHNIVESCLSVIDEDIAASYRNYRNYKKDFVHMLDDVYTKSQSIRYIGDVSNANTDSAMISTQRSLIYGELNKNIYQKFFLSTKELQAAKDGYIYIHDMKDRLDGVNCMLYDLANVLKGGFEMGNVWYNEPNTLDVAFDVISDITMSASSQEYGGFTLPQIDKVLVPYARKSYNLYKKEYADLCKDFAADVNNDKAHSFAMKKLERDMDQGFQSWEYKFNTVGSSRGDYPQ